VGFRNSMPRLELPKPINVHHMGNFNNIRVDRSVVGSINTGEVGRIDVALDNVRAGGQDDLADQLQVLTQAVVESKELTREAQNQALETLSSLTEQAALPREKRRGVRALLVGLEHFLTDSASLTALFQIVAPHLHRLL
jgi:hypothetical protein